VVVNDDRLNVINGITTALMDKWDGRELFGYGGVLTRRSGYRLKPVNKDTFGDLVATAATTVAQDPKSGAYSAQWPDSTSMSAALSRADSYAVLNRITRAPFLRPDGTVCASSGYDESTGTYVELDPGMKVTIPDQPDSGDVENAIKMIREWLGDFLDAMPTDADRANTIALVLTPLVRGLVPLAPLMVVSGLQMGVGKNLLADVISIFALGEPTTPLPYGGDEENRKVITAAFRSGANMLIFDEAHVLEGAALARAITAITYTDRILGVSVNAEYPNTATWMALGNRVSINGDLSRRAVVIELAPKMENPQDRSADDFRHPDIKDWTRKHRADLLSAALTLCRAWYVAGCPQNPAGRRLGSFEQWGGMVGGVLDVAGVPGFLETLREHRSESDYERKYWLAHTVWLYGRSKGAPFSTNEVVRWLKADAEAAEYPPGMDDAGGPGFSRRLGQAYGRQRGKILEGYRLERMSASAGHGHKWQVLCEGDPFDGPGGDTGPVDTPPAVTLTRERTSPVKSEDKTDNPRSDGVQVDGLIGLIPTTLRTGKNVIVDDHEDMCVFPYKGQEATPRSTQSTLTPSDLDVSVLSPGLIASEEGLTAGVRSHVSVTGEINRPGYAPGAFAPLLPLVREPKTPVCPSCSGAKELVPPTRFWWACPNCHSASFTRG
jgi:hypothetical protein